jgi:hypothetical protein
MPMMVRTRKYDAAFYATFGAQPVASARRYDEIFGANDD